MIENKEDIEKIKKNRCMKYWLYRKKDVFLRW